MRSAWLLAFLLACTSTSASGDDQGSGVLCTLSLEGTACQPSQGYCAIEGQVSCSSPPTSGGCNCDSDGTWHCYCSCYGPLSTCEVNCPPTSERASGAMCDPAGYQCTYPDRTCTCTDTGTTGLQFVCT
jgi:hypothetical protein